MAVGSVVGLAISGMLSVGIEKTDKENCYQVLRSITFTQNCFITAVCLLMLLLFREKPNEPPSAVAFVKQSRKKLGKTMYKKLLGNRTYVGNGIIFTILWGTYTAIGNLLSPLFGPYYEPSQISLISGVFVLMGVLGCYLAGVVIDRTKLMLGTIRTIATLVTIILLLEIWVIPSGAFWPTLIVSGLLGFFIVPSITACYTFTVHLTYPIPPAASNGLIMTGAHIYAIIFSLAGPKMMDTWFYILPIIWTVLCLGAAIISYVIYNPNQNGSMKQNEADPEISISVMGKEEVPTFGKKPIQIDINKRSESLNQHETMTESFQTPVE